MISRFFCTQCGKEGIPIFRKGTQRRELGHLKKIYCIHCGKECNHVEIAEKAWSYTYEDFLKEYNGHNFDKEGNRIVPLKKFLGENE